MSCDNFNAVLLAIAFLVPGFILSSVLASTFRRRSRSPADLMLQYLTLSCVNYGLWSWLIALMIQGDWVSRHPLFTALLVFTVLFASPVLLGALAPALSRKPLVKRVLSAVGFNVDRFIPTAWDFKFEQETPSWVIVRLRDGASVYGFWGSESFAGDEPGERDLFLEAVFQPSNEGHWQPAPDTAGILIRADEIATIEFRRVDSGPRSL